MIVSLPYVKQKFQEFNLLYFDGKLPDVPVELGRARSYVGICRFRKRVKWFGRTENEGFHLRFSTRFDLPEEEWEDTILHEMIHYYIGVNQLKDTSAHGRVFRQMMNAINEQYGRHISVTHKTTPEQREQIIDQRARWHVVAVVTLKDGRTGIKVIPRIRQRILSYRRGLMASGTVQSIDFYLTNDPFFNRYPNSAALHVYFLDMADIQSHLDGATKLTVTGRAVISG